MKNKLIAIFGWLMMCGTILATPVPIQLEVYRDDHKPTIPHLPKSPIIPPEIVQDGYSFYFDADHYGYTLCLVNEDNDIVYSVYVPSTLIVVTLPSTLNGDYELRLIPNDGSGIYFYGYVEF